MSALIFDTETTGLPNYKAPVNNDSQPYIVQLAAILVDDEGDTVSEMSVIIKPNGWTIPEEVAKIHGIDDRRANRYSS